MSFHAINRHDRNLAHDLSLESYGVPPPSRCHRVLIPIAGVHRGVLEPFIGCVDDPCALLQPNERLTIVVPQSNPIHS